MILRLQPGRQDVELLIVNGVLVGPEPFPLLPVSYACTTVLEKSRLKHMGIRAHIIPMPGQPQEWDIEAQARKELGL